MKSKILLISFLGLSVFVSAQKPIFKSEAFTVYPDRVVQGTFEAKALSSVHMISNYESPDIGRKSDEMYVEKAKTDAEWILSKDLSALPRYSSPYLISDAIYNLSLEEMLKAVEPDSTFRTGKEWSGVWTRDISYSIILSMAHMQPKVAKYSLMRKVKNDRIIQDTGTGGAYPCSTDRMIWAVAAWELYKATGDNDWLGYAYKIVKNSMTDDMVNAYDPNTGLYKGESSFLDWREETYPRWMQPADIYMSENLGTNVVMYQANKVLAKMAQLQGDSLTARKHSALADGVKAGLNKYLWIEGKGYFGQYLYGRNFLSLSPRAEALGEALSVYFGLAENTQAQRIIAGTPVVPYGISCIYPQIPNIPPYHNNAIWPFVQTYWTLASAKAGNEKSVVNQMAAIYRPAALWLTNKENFVAQTGDFAGTQINSSVMLWSLSGNIALIHRVLFGMNFETDKLVFNPFVLKVMGGNRKLENFTYRKAKLNISMSGYGNRIKHFMVDGVETQPEIAGSLSGEHQVQIELYNNDNTLQSIHLASNDTTVETPEVKLDANQLKWQVIPSAVKYNIIKNGVKIGETTSNSYKPAIETYASYQVIAEDNEKIGSFASEPVVIAPDKKIFPAEDFADVRKTGATGFHGKGFVDISTTSNRDITFAIRVKNSGLYNINFRYANGNGPINTENKCAIRSLEVNDKFAGIFVFPHRGKDDWTLWGNSNDLKINLNKGLNKIRLIFKAENENMNGEINQAFLDEMNLTRIQ